MITDDAVRSNPIMIVIMAILKFMIGALIATMIMWGIVWFEGVSIINTEMEYLTNKIVEMNCLDVTTGEYALFCERLYRVNKTSNFVRFDIQAVEVINAAGQDTKQVDVSGDAMVRYNIPITSTGHDSFSVRTSNGTVDGDGKLVFTNDVYNYGVAPQQYQPIEVRLWCRVYLPMPIYFGKSYLDTDTTLNLEGGMRPSVLPRTAGEANPTPALAVNMFRRQVVLGTRFFKGQAATDAYDYNTGT